MAQAQEHKAEADARVAHHLNEETRRMLARLLARSGDLKRLAAQQARSR